MGVNYLVGDTRKVIATIPDGSVDLIATSPPFLALRSYVPADHASKGDEIGSEANPAAFIDMLLGLTAEWGRVLAPHGSIAIELGDTYSGSGGAGGDYNEGGLRDRQGKFDGSASRDKLATYKDQRGNPDGMRDTTFQGGNTRTGSGPGWPRAKSLALVPQLYAVALAYGINPLTGQPSPAGRWLVRNVVVWHRPNPAVGALGDKVRPSTSYIIIATRSPKRWFDLTAVRHDHSRANYGNVGRIKQVPDTRSDFQTAYYTDAHPAGAPPLDAWFDQYDGSHDTWTLTTQPSRLAHYAMWPAKLAERLVLMMCPREVCRVCGEPRRRMEGAAEYVRTDSDVVPPRLAQINGHRIANGINQHHDGNGANTSVIRNAPTLGWTDCGHGDYRPGHTLDPFCGSGTTLAVADLHGRDATGIDFDQRNHDLYPARYDEVKRALYGTMPEMPGQMELAL